MAKVAKTSKRQPKRQHPWFKSVRGSYLPASWQAWLLYLVAIAYLAAGSVYMQFGDVEMAWALSKWFIDLVLVGVALTWIAEKTS
jgi:hypothetical protein